MKAPASFLRIGFNTVVRVLIQVLLGRDVRDRGRLPTAGPAILVANHNSHLDTVVLATLFPNRLLHAVRPVAAVDYFLRSPTLAWFVLEIIGVIPIDRQSSASRLNPLEPCLQALARGEILILFPEGTRGTPEHMSALKAGVAHLAEAFPHVPVVPVFLHGLGKSLPRGHRLPIPFNCTVLVGDPLHFATTKQAFLQSLAKRFAALQQAGSFPPWN